MERARLEVRQNLGDRLVAGRPVSCHAAGEDLLDVQRGLRIQFRHRLRFVREPPDHHLVRRIARERNLAAGHLVEDHAEREDVRPRVGLLAPHLLRRHVERRPQNGAHLRHGAAGERLGEAEVGQVRRAGRVEHDVLRLQVAVDDALLVRRREPLADLTEQREEPRQRKAPLALEHALEVLALDVLHRQVPDPVVLAEVVDAKDVPVRDAAGELDLPLEALEDLAVLRDLGTDELEGHVAVELQIADLVHGSHATPAEELHDPVPVSDLEPLGKSRLAGMGGQAAARRPARGRRGRRLPGRKARRRGREMSRAGVERRARLVETLVALFARPGPRRGSGFGSACRASTG